VAPEHPISQLGGWEGYEVESCVLQRRSGRCWCVVRLKVTPDRRRCCSGCLRWCESIHDVEVRRVRDLPIFEHRVELLVPRVRVACAQCGPKLELLPWLEAYARVTQRLGESVARLCKVASILHVARHFELDWKTVKDLDRRHLERELGPVNLDGIEVIGLDEFAIEKGHRYATVIVEPTRKRVLWVGRGHTREDVRPFLRRTRSDRPSTRRSGQ
jgi:transposase